MRIGVIILSLLFIFGLSISLMSEKVKDKASKFGNQATSIKILNWKKAKNKGILGYAFTVQKINTSSLKDTKIMECKLLDKNQEEIGSIEKRIIIEYSGVSRFFVKGETEKVKYLDCSFN